MIVHFVITAIYFVLIVKIKKNWLTALCESSFVLLIPGFGLIFMIVMNLAKSPSEDPSYVYKDFCDKRMLLREFSLKESDILPIQDALMLEDNTAKRSLLLEVIKRNVLKNDELLFKATRDEDTEISHYAVSVVTNKIQIMGDIFHELGKKLSRHPNDIDVLKEYADTLKGYLKIGFLDKLSKMNHEKDYVDLLAKILSLDKTEKKYFLEKINHEIDLANFDEAQKYCDLFLKSFSNHEEPYLQYIKLYHKLKDLKIMREYIAQLKAADIKISKESLDIIRFWDENKTA